MVNSGGPSKGCLTCIQRKIRCDRQRPVCGQCTKSKRHCKGYRNTADTMFRDQTQSVIGAQWESRKTTPTRDSPDSTDTSIATAETNVSSSDMPNMLRSPKLHGENGLIDFFANNFTCNNFRPGTNLYWVPTNFNDLLKTECTKLSVQSVGAMALARLQRSAYYHREAQKSYGLALLSLAEQSREDPGMSTDSVLFTVLFLSFFEILASYDSGGRQSYLTHLNGLGTLLGRRSEQFLRSGLGVRMLLQSRSQAIFDALRNKTPVAQIYQKPLPPAPFPLPPQIVYSNKIDMLMIRLAALQAHCRSIGPSQTLVNELIALDASFVDWTENLAPSWAYSHHPNSYYSGLWWDARCDVYPAPVIAHVWNKVRAARILTLDLIQETTLQLSILEGIDFDSDLLYASAELNTLDVQRLATDICATIPNYYRPPNGFGDTHKSGIPPLLGTTYWLLWPIEVIGCMREASPDLVEWLLRCLERVFTTTGIMKAQVAIERIKKGRRTAALP